MGLNEQDFFARVFMQNLELAMAERSLDFEGLSGLLQQVGFEISAERLREFSESDVSIDLAIACSLVLGFSPVNMILPPVRGDGQIPLAPEISVGWQDAWRWMLGEKPVETAVPGDIPVSTSWQAGQDFIRRNRPHEDHPSAEAVTFMCARIPPGDWTFTIQSRSNGPVSGRMSRPGATVGMAALKRPLEPEDPSPDPDR